MGLQSGSGSGGCGGSPRCSRGAVKMRWTSWGGAWLWLWLGGSVAVAGWQWKWAIHWFLNECDWSSIGGAMMAQKVAVAGGGWGGSN
jgi:hypothetical protein